MFERQSWHYLTATAIKAHLHSIKGRKNGTVFSVVADIELVAVAGLQFNPSGAGHQSEERIPNVEVEQVASAGVGDQKKTAFVEPPELLHGETGCAFVLR